MNGRYQSVSRCDGVQKKALNLDIYRTPFLFKLPDNKERYRTFLGAILSVLTIIAVLAYGGYKFLVLFDYADYKVQAAVSENFYDLMDSFESPKGFNIAAGVTRYDSTAEVVEDPDYGTVKFYLKSYGLGEPGIAFDELPTRMCEPASDFNDVDGSNPSASFF